MIEKYIRNHDFLICSFEESIQGRCLMKRKYCKLAKLRYSKKDRALVRLSKHTAASIARSKDRKAFEEKEIKKKLMTD